MTERDPPTAAAALFTACGLALAVVPPLVDLWIALTPGAPPAHLHGAIGGAKEDFSVFLPMATTGVAFVAFAQAATRPALFAAGEGRARFLAFLLLVFDGVLHLFALAPHAAEPPRLAFFGVVGPLEIGGGLWLLRHPSASPRPWLALAALLLALYLAALSLPLGGPVEVASPLGITAKAVEVVLLVPLLSLLRPAAAAGGTAAAAPRGHAGRAP